MRKKRVYKMNLIEKYYFQRPSLKDYEGTLPTVASPRAPI